MFSNPAQFARMLTEIGVPIPKPAAAELATLQALTTAKDVDHVGAAVAAASSGKLTAKTAGDHLNNLAENLIRSERYDAAARALESPIVARWYAALRADRDTLMSGMVDASIEPLAIVQEAGRHFGTTARPADVLDAGIDAVTVWEKLTAALSMLDLIRNVRVQLGDLWGEGEQDVTWWIASADDAAHLDHAHLIYSRTGNALHNLAEAGFTLRLNTPEQITAVKRAARARTDNREAERAEAEAARLREIDAIRQAN